jgi:hypothetical protein
MAAGQSVDERTGVWPPFQGEGSQLQAYDPSFHAGRQGLYIAGGEAEGHSLVQELGGFLVGEAQPVNAQLPAAFPVRR